MVTVAEPGYIPDTVPDWGIHPSAGGGAASSHPLLMLPALILPPLLPERSPCLPESKHGLPVPVGSRHGDCCVLLTRVLHCAVTALSAGALLT